MANEAFDYFDKVYVINLDSDQGRLERVSERLARMRVSFERNPAIVPPAMNIRCPDVLPGHFGCAMSHMQVLDLARRRCNERCLILEDDVLFRDDAEALLARALPCLKGVAWDVLYLGLHLVEKGPDLGPFVGSVKEGYHTHSYAVSRDGIAKVAASITESLRRLDNVFDKFEHAEMLKLYINPILTIQEPNFSATYGREINRIGQYFERFFDVNDFRAHSTEMQIRGF